MNDPFEILGVERSFDLDEARVRRAYLSRIATMHPDATDDGVDADSGTAALNDAKRVLEDPERRANALLAVLGGATKEEDRSLPDGFLMEVMELRERVEGVLESGEGALRREVEREARSMREAYIQRVGALFRSGGESPGRDALRAIRIELNALRYVERLIEQLDPSYDPARADFER